MKNIIIISIVFILFIAACGEKDTLVSPSIDDNDLTSIYFSPQSFNLKIPPNFPQMEIPADNALTTEGVELGKRLFYDPIFSRDSTMSCASCHLSVGGFTDNKALSKGVAGLDGFRSSMSLENVGFFNKGLFWDGHAKTLEEQALLPIEDPRELHTNWDKVVEKLRKHKDYPNRFRKAFGIASKNDISKTLAAKAIAQFERTLISGNAKFDKIFRREDSFTDDELDGYQLFFNAAGAPDAQCGHCHTTPFFNSNDYFNNGLDSVNNLKDFKDLGRGIVTKRV